MQSVVGLTEYDKKGRARHIPPQIDPTVGLLRNMLCSSCVCFI